MILSNRPLRRTSGGVSLPPWLMDPAIWLQGTNFIWLMPNETESASAIPMSKHPLRMAPEWPNYNVSSWAAAARRTDHGIPERLELTTPNFSTGSLYYFLDSPEMGAVFDMVTLIRTFNFTSNNPGQMGSGPALYHPTDGYWVGFARGSTTNQSSPEALGMAHGVGPSALLNGAANWAGYVPTTYDPNTKDLYFRMRQEGGRLKVRWWVSNAVEPDAWPIDIERAPTVVRPAIQASYTKPHLFWMSVVLGGGDAPLHPNHQ